MMPPGRKSTKSDDGEVSFPALQSLNPLTNVATIAAEFEGRRVLCRVKIDDLRKKFRVFKGEPMDMVIGNRKEIENAARHLIENRKFEADGSVMIKYQEL